MCIIQRMFNRIYWNCRNKSNDDYVEYLKNIGDREYGML